MSHTGSANEDTSRLPQRHIERAQESNSNEVLKTMLRETIVAGMASISSKINDICENHFKRIDQRLHHVDMVLLEKPSLEMMKPLTQSILKERVRSFKWLPLDQPREIILEAHQRNPFIPYSEAEHDLLERFLESATSIVTEQMAKLRSTIASELRAAIFKSFPGLKKHRFTEVAGMGRRKLTDVESTKFLRLSQTWTEEWQKQVVPDEEVELFDWLVKNGKLSVYTKGKTDIDSEDDHEADEESRPAKRPRLERTSCAPTASDRAFGAVVLAAMRIGLTLDFASSIHNGQVVRHAGATYATNSYQHYLKELA